MDRAPESEKRRRRGQGLHWVLFAVALAVLAGVLTFVVPLLGALLPLDAGDLRRAEPVRAWVRAEYWDGVRIGVTAERHGVEVGIVHVDDPAQQDAIVERIRDGARGRGWGPITVTFRVDRSELIRDSEGRVVGGRPLPPQVIRVEEL